MKRQPTEWENIYANTSDKGLLWKIYKELLIFNTKKTDSSIKKWVKDLDTSPERIHRWPEDNERILITTNHQKNAD